MRPSFIIGVISGTLVTVATFIFFYELAYKKTPVDNINLAYILMGLAAAYGIHGLSHSFEEIYFDFNPLDGKWHVNDEPICRCGHHTV
jgi:hypothetical protein